MRDGTADGASESETRVERQTAELLGLNGWCQAFEVDGGHCDRDGAKRGEETVMKERSASEC